MGDARLHDYYFESLKKLYDFFPYEDWSKFSIEFANVRLEQLESMWEHLQASEAVNENRISFGDAKRMYVCCKAILLRHIMELKSVRAESPSPSEISDLNVDVYESEIKLLDRIGIFDGDFTKWFEFRTRFIANVHANATLRNAEKLNMLATAVTERAARVLGKWELTDANYELAWNKLCGVYSNQYQIARAHIQSLQTLPRLEPVTFDGIFDLIDRVIYAQRQLLTMGVPVEKWDLMIIYLVEERLDVRSRDAWIAYQENNKILLPKWDEMSEFLQRRAVMAHSSQANSSSADISNANSPVSNAKHAAQHFVTDQLRVKSERNEALIPKRKPNSYSVKKKEIRQKSLPMIGRKSRRRRTIIGTGMNRMNVGNCIVCNATKNVRFVNCMACSARGHLSCLRKLMDSENHELNWKCPKCSRCAACNNNGEMGILYKCTVCLNRYHSNCLGGTTEVPATINLPEIKCYNCTQPRKESDE